MLGWGRHIGFHSDCACQKPCGSSARGRKFGSDSWDLKNTFERHFRAFSAMLAYAWCNVTDCFGTYFNPHLSRESSDGDRDLEERLITRSGGKLGKNGAGGVAMSPNMRRMEGEKGGGGGPRVTP